MSPESQKHVFPIQWLRAACLCTLLALPIVTFAQDLRLKLPKRSKPTPVQKLNQDGVKAVEKHDYERAKKLFYKAYLLDPNDPFTLNNLGYIAELDGEIERAQRFYSLAAEQPSQAAIATASSPGLKGKEVAEVAGNAADRQMEINRANINAMGLLLKDRAPEADIALQKALALDQKNPFTLNNLGFAKEKEGELELALKYYSDAANTGSNEPVVVTVNKGWRGKPIREIASDNASKVRKEIDRGENPESKVARLNLRGVSALNRNERRLARQYFEEAFKVNPNNAFTLNNMGYLAETDGDRETAQFFYAKAAEAQRNDAKVVSATRRDVEGLRMGAVAAVNDQTVSEAQQKDLEARRRGGGEVSLLRRDNSRVVEPALPVNPAKRESGAPVLLPRDQSVAQPGEGGAPSNQGGQPSGDLLEPLPDNAQPANAAPGGRPKIHPADEMPTGGQPIGVPSNQPLYPSDTNPNPASPNTQPPATQPQGGIIEPLPDNQQPPNADRGAAPQQQQPVGQRTQQILPPLPDNQQPGAEKGAPTQQPNTTPPPNTQPPPPQK